MKSIRRIAGWLLAMNVAANVSADAGPARFRKPAPLEDEGRLLEEPTFGACAGHEGSDGHLHVMEWIAKRTWHILGLPYERKDFQGPPDLKGVKRGDSGVDITGTVAVTGVPLRNQVIACELEQRDTPVLIVLRSTDAFGELLLELDLRAGTVRARSVTVSRSMIGGQSHSSPMPEESFNQVVASSTFPAVGSGWGALRIRTQGARVALWLNGREIARFEDPDPAGGVFGFGSTGTVGVRNVEQWELISPAEKERREQCLREMHVFCKDLDAEFEGDVRKRNEVHTDGGEVTWRWPATGATARFGSLRGGVMATIRAGLYGDDVLIDGDCPRVTVTSAGGEVFHPDPERKPRIRADRLGVRMTIPLRSSSGARAEAEIRVKFSVQTVWFWRVTVEGTEARSIEAALALAPPFAFEGEKDAEAKPGEGRRTVLRHNAKAGLFVKILDPGNGAVGPGPGGQGELTVSTTDPELGFATVILPSQPLNKVGFSHRMVHYIKYPEGPIEHWRRRPSFQEYPTNVDLARFRGNGTDAMVWHHTWISSDFRDREGFLLNDEEMGRAMAETHRLGMKAIGYIGIVPGRNALLRIDDICPLGGAPRLGVYDKNWDLQDFTFYHVAGRIQEFLPWMTDYWCREYGLDGFYLDGGLAHLSSGAMKGPLHPEDAGLSLDELQHRLYYRVRKVFERRKAGFGIETWGGLNWMLTGFYDCIMIGESFQEAPPELYRDTNNALLTGCCIKMYGMRESSQNPYNVAMAAVGLGDIQVCSGNGAWGDLPDTTETWARVRPYWDVIKTVDWDSLIEARPWYAQELVNGEGFYAANYIMPDRVLIFLANRTEQRARVEVRVDVSRLPKAEGEWRVRYVLGRFGDAGALADGRLRLELPPLHDGPIGIELAPARQSRFSKGKRFGNISGIRED